MKQRACAVFRSQRVEYALRFTCEHCTYFHEQEERCTHGYPNAAHRLAVYDGASDGELVFCKDFELR